MTHTLVNKVHDIINKPENTYQSGARKSLVALQRLKENLTALEFDEVLEFMVESTFLNSDE